MLGPMFPLDQQRIDHIAPECLLHLASIVALQHVIDHPDAHARRLARWLAGRRATGAKRPVPFNFENVPGLNHQRLDPMLRDDALFFNDAAFYKATAPPR